MIVKIEQLPALVHQAVQGAAEEQLNIPYRPGGWTARQVIHHLADSHLNSYIRCKLIATESGPTLKAYSQDDWAQLPDSSTGPIEPSLAILSGLHQRWAAFFRALPESAWSRVGYHTENGPMTLARILESYAAHGERHLTHIRQGIAAL
ncbi:MAG: putative metal-dependent hydrolase [Acidobacteria bacterium]|nr:putative metal-dependent hydrolase [Acidobacteriota bacterium]